MQSAESVITYFARVFSAELNGIEARRVDVEVDMHVGLHSFAIVGLADKALSEARERVSSALKNTGVKPPNKENRKIVVNLAPADIRKTGSQYDLAIALGYLLATKQIKEFTTNDKLFVGELALDGSVRGIRGVLNIARMARVQNIKEIFVPAENAREAAIIAGITVIPLKTLHECMAHLEGAAILMPAPQTEISLRSPEGEISLDDIKGQEHAKRALIIAAAGGHHVLMTGFPGGGKTMLARAFIGLLPLLSLDEVIEITQIYSAAGLLDGQSFVGARPFRAPHHTASEAAVIGGGTHPRPGEISLAHRGALFFDELPEFHRDVLESLRDPMESGRVVIARAKNSLTLPARFSFIAAMNPCPCGYYGDDKKECSCSAHAVVRYQKKISGPILDRIDIQIAVPRVELHDLKNKKKSGVAAMAVQKSVARARDVQYARSGRLNADLSSKQCDEGIAMTAAADSFLEKMWHASLLSARGYYRVLKVAQTIADIDGATTVDEKHLAEAFSYRLKDK